ncbi:hypothetical protein K466DRAFT_665611 [Polyporus arcularius HHB13444]|uniref:Uncharacterized protein n=1 Tax=Polyporus arcularius HHB13444 TaxID=1314778 RepID=A0A5C3P2Q1_9APHY|nr:hypothetical protein K466DRAFT_665611 [Polyporus arcularius HHB13444]
MAPQAQLSEDEVIARWLGDEAIVAIDSLVKLRLQYDHSKRERHERILDAIFRVMQVRANSARAEVSAWLEQHEEHKRQLTERGVLLEALDRASDLQSYGIVVSQIIYYYNHPELIGTDPYGETLGSLSPHVCDVASWRVGYRGSGHRALYNALSELQRDSSTGMAKLGLVPVVIGTGAGKSRMVEEMANSVFIVTMRLGRPSIGSNVFGELNERSPDHAVYVFLVEETVIFDPERTLIRNLAFMTGLTTALRNVLPSMGANASEYGLLVSSWPGYYQNASRRRDILLRAIREAKELESKYQSQEALVPLMRDAMTKLCVTIPDPAAPTKTARSAPIPVKSLKLIFSFDEKVSNGSYTGTFRHDPMSTCFAELTGLPVMGIVLSRSPKVLTTSGRSSLKLPLQVLFPFESHSDDESGRSSDEKELNNVSQLSSICRFGRPLFFAHLQAIEHELPRLWDYRGKKPDMPPAEYIIGHARSQLLGGSGHTGGFWEVRRSGTYGPLAVLDVRLALDLDAHTDIALGASERMVAENMCILYHDPKRPHALLSCYPSEPVLAEAAAQQMWHWRPEGPQSMSLLDVLVEESKRGLVALDDDDACLVGRYILLLSHDRAIGTLPVNPGAPIPNQPWFSDEVPLSRFISSIFTSKKASQVLRCLPDNVMDGGSLEEVFQDAFVHFTHFVKVQSAAITLDGLRAAYIRGAAFRIIGRKRPVDCVIPIRIKKGVGLESVFSLMAFTFNNDDDTTSLAQMRLDPKAQGYFPEHDQYIRPFIMLKWEFAAATQTEERSAEDSMEIDERTEIPSSVQSIGDDHIHPRYTIQARGISPDTFAEVNEWDKDKYQYLLTFQKGQPAVGEDIFKAPYSSGKGHGQVRTLGTSRKWDGGELLAMNGNWKPSVVV